MFKAVALLFLVSISALANPQSPGFDIKAIVNKLPNKTLDVPLIIALGAKSESFKITQAEFSLAEVSKLDASALFTPKLKFSVYSETSESETNNPTFAPIMSETNNYEFSIAKSFTSGTLLDFTYSQLNFDPTYSATSIIDIPAYYESVASLKISQSLWRNFLGKASRAQMNAGKIASESQALKAQYVTNQWFTGIVNQLYVAWAAQQRTIASKETLERRKELLKIATINKKRGTANTKDFLQLKASVVTAEINFNEAMDQLQAYWEELLVKAGLPIEWKSTQLFALPLKLDNPIQEALEVCAGPDFISNQIQASDKAMQAARLQEVAAKSLAKPDLQIFGTYSGNEIANTSGAAHEDITAFNNPTWAVGLELKMPFSFDKEKADYLRAYSARLNAEASLASAKDEQTLTKSNTCRLLAVKSEIIKKLETVLSDLKQRENIEYKDFRTGRTTSFSYIQSGDDVSAAQLNLISQQILTRNIAWSIISSKKNLLDKISEYSKNMN